MKQKYFIAILLLLSLVTPLAALADSFKVNPVNLEQGKTGTLTFTLENTQDFYGFQAEIKLPAGLVAVKASDGKKLDVTLSSRAGAGNYFVNSNTLSSGNLIIGAFSQNHKPFTGNSGALFDLKVQVADNFAGGDVTVTNIKLIDINDKDVTAVSTQELIGVAASKITLNEISKELKVGGTVTLTATVTPENATEYSDVEWSTSDDKIAAVDEEGKVTAKAIGKATITATCGSVSATCEVTVVATPVESVSFTRKTLTLSLTEDGNKTTTLKPNFTPATATDKTVTWKSSDESVATVSAEGVVTALKLGTTTITATSSNGKVATSVVTVSDNLIHVTSITISSAELNLTAGDKATLTATVKPDNATDLTVEWSSDDTDVATVSEAGEVIAVSAGTAKITATSFDGKTATCTVNVAAKVILPTAVKLDKETAQLRTGATTTLKATLTPTDVTDKTLVWTSSDEKVATVDQKGKVTAVAAGQATITVASKAAPAVKAECKVTVIVPVTSLVILDENEEEIGEDTVIEFHTGHEYNLTAVVGPSNATDKTVTWTTSDDTVIKFLDDEGLMDGLKAGEATVTASIAGFSVTVKVKVTDPVIPVEGITLDKTTASMVVNGTLTLVATLSPADATSKDITWSSSDKTIATVSTQGVVKALKAGTVTITATSNKKSATCVITITDPTSGVALGSDSEAPVQVYDLAGRYVADKVEGLGAGLYIVRQGNDVKKVRVR